MDVFFVLPRHRGAWILAPAPVAGWRWGKLALFGNLFGSLFGDSAPELPARGDQFAGVNNWRRAVDVYRRALQKTSRSSLGYRRLAAKFDEARVRSFDAIVEDIHSRIDVREFTYATDQIATARALAESDAQLASLEECESRLRAVGRGSAATKVPAAWAPSRSAGELGAQLGSNPGPGARLAPTSGHGGGPPLPAGARLEAPRPEQHAAEDPRLRETPSRVAAASLAHTTGVKSDLAPRPDPAGDQAFQKHLSSLSASDVAARVRLGPRYRDAALALAHGEAQRATELFIQALEDHPNDTTVLYDLASALTAAGRTREAQGVYHRLAQIDPQAWQPYYEMAEVLWLDGLRDRAIQALEEGLELHPRSGSLMAQWGVFLAKLGHPRQALDKLYLALQLDSFDDAGLFHAIANLHLELGELEKARRGYLKALELNPHSVGTMLDYAEFLLDHKRDPQAALAILETAFRTLRAGKPQRLLLAYRSYLCSRAHMMVGEREMALLSVTRALEENDQAWLEETLEKQRQAVFAV